MGFNPQLIDSVACISFHLQDMKTIIIILSIIAQGNDDKKNFYFIGYNDICII